MGGVLVYLARDGDNTFKSLKLTVCTDDDRRSGSLAMRRRKRLSRILNEALMQGVRLSYRDLGIIMLSSRATLKRDVRHLRDRGIDVPLCGRTGNCG
jgi:hypothetical protein